MINWLSLVILTLETESLKELRVYVRAKLESVKEIVPSRLANAMILGETDILVTADECTASSETGVERLLSS